MVIHILVAIKEPVLTGLHDICVSVHGYGTYGCFECARGVAKQSVSSVSLACGAL